MRYCWSEWKSVVCGERFCVRVYVSRLCVSVGGEFVVMIDCGCNDEYAVRVAYDGRRFECDADGDGDERSGF